MTEIIELPPGHARLGPVWPVLRELRPHLEGAGFEDRYAEAHTQGFRVVALFDEGVCRAAAGYRIGMSLANGRHLHVDDLVTAEGFRSRGYGRSLLDHLVDVATEAGCECLTLDSGVHRFDAHRFYLRERFVISSHHFWRGLIPGAEASSMRKERP